MYDYLECLVLEVVVCVVLLSTMVFGRPFVKRFARVMLNYAGEAVETVDDG